MGITLRVLLIISSLLMALYVIKKIRTSQIQLKDARFWILLSVFLIIISVFPDIIYWLCGIVGIISPINLVFLIIILLLLIKLFLVSIVLSRAETRIDELTQEVAIRDERFIKIETEDDMYIKKQDSV